MKLLAPADVQAQRIETCQGCDKYRVATGQCRVCFCFMAIKSKLENAKCPLGKWDAPKCKYCKAPLNYLNQGRFEGYCDTCEKLGE